MNFRTDAVLMPRTRQHQSSANGLSLHQRMVGKRSAHETVCAARSPSNVSNGVFAKRGFRTRRSMGLGQALASADEDNSGLAVMTKRDELFEMAREIDQLLQTIRQILKQPLEIEFAPGELTGPQRSVMQALVATNGLSLKELSKVVGLAHSTVSGIVDRLERRGLVKRLVGESDRRITRIVITDTVLESVRKHWPGFSISPLVIALGHAVEDDRTSILNGLQKLRNVLDLNRETRQIK